MDNGFIKTTDDVVINNNSEEFKRYKEARSRAKEKNLLVNRIEKLEQDVESLKKIIQGLHSRIN